MTTKPSDITVVRTGANISFESWSVKSAACQDWTYDATFRGPGAKERAEAEAQRMRDDLPKWHVTYECSEYSEIIFGKPGVRVGDTYDVRGSNKSIRAIALAEWLNSNENPA